MPHPKRYQPLTISVLAMVMHRETSSETSMVTRALAPVRRWDFIGILRAFVASRADFISKEVET